MNVMIGHYCKAVLGMVAWSLTFFAAADMKPIADDELSQYSGQAAIAVDVNTVGTDSYTKVTLGMEIDVQMNIEALELGHFDVPGESATDVDIQNMGFGSISTNDTQIQLDGQTYALNEIIPFELNDPYFEIAQDDTTGELKGFRIGFGEARGQLSGDFNSISGNIGVDITDYFGDDYRSQMLDASGNEDSSRARFFGISSAYSGGATTCAVGGGFYCYDLADYKSFDVGQRNRSTGNVDYTRDFFMSFQKEATNWTTSDGSVAAGMGAFINIPTALHIDMNTGMNASGTERPRLEYIDRGNDLF
jgi:hypothetical protein